MQNLIISCERSLCSGSALPGQHHRCALRSNPGPAVMLPTAGVDTKSWWWSLKSAHEMVKIADARLATKVECFTAAVVILLRWDRGIDGGKTGSWLLTNRGDIWAHSLASQLKKWLMRNLVTPGLRFEQGGFFFRMVNMGNAAGCNVCGSDILVNHHGSDTDVNHHSEVCRAAGSECDNDESVVRSSDNGTDHQLFS